jgi:hypothetical protein
VSEYVKLEERKISGKGVLKVPPTALKYRYYVMYVDLLRTPSNRYLSRDWNPDKSVYARMAFRRDEYVQFDQIIEYEKQQFTYVNDICGQTLIAVKCSYEGILQSFVNLVNGMAGTPGGIGIFVTSVDNKIEDFKNLALGWDEILFKCYGDAALLVRFYGADYYKCNPDEETSDYPPPPPPAPPPVPPGTPITDISPPYDPSDDDDNNTEPFPGDVPFELPFGEACIQYDVKLFWNNLDGRIGEFTFRVFGEIEGAGVSESQWYIYILCRGGQASLEPPAGACLPTVQECIVIGSTFPDYASVEIISIVEVA